MRAIILPFQLFSHQVVPQLIIYMSLKGYNTQHSGNMDKKNQTENRNTTSQAN